MKFLKEKLQEAEKENEMLKAEIAGLKEVGQWQTLDSKTRYRKVRN